MTTAQEKMHQASEKIAKHKDELSSINAIYKFVLEGDGGGTWILDLRDNPFVSEGEGDAQCTIRMQASDYVEMVEGRANGQQLFFTGKLKVEGDMGLAMKLTSITEIIK